MFKRVGTTSFSSAGLCDKMFFKTEDVYQEKNILFLFVPELLPELNFCQNPKLASITNKNVPIKNRLFIDRKLKQCHKCIMHKASCKTNQDIWQLMQIICLTLNLSLLNEKFLHKIIRQGAQVLLLSCRTQTNVNHCKIWKYKEILIVIVFFL